MNLTKSQLDEKFLQALTEALVHVNAVYARHVREKRVPTKEQIFGEFTTSLRRSIKFFLSGTPIESWCCGLTKAEVWDDIGIPCASRGWHTHHWNHQTLLPNGESWQMDSYKAGILASQARIKASYASQEDMASADIALSLNRLEQELKGLNASAGVAASLNQEADQVLANLCKIAETLAS